MKNGQLNFGVIFQATLPALLAFILVDSITEVLIFKFSGLAVTDYFEKALNKSFALKFHAVNLFSFTIEMYLVMLFYGLTRLIFTDFVKRVAITSLFFIIFILLFLIQMINLGIYPLNIGMVFIFTTTASFPVSVYVGAFIYEKIICRKTN